MKMTVGKAMGSLVACAAMTVAMTPAEAQRYGRPGWNGGGHYGGHYDRHYRGRGSRTGLALSAGALGLALGAAMASNNRGGYYYDRGYDYAPPPRRNYRPRCYTERVWDDYEYRWVRVRYCD
ncbi:MAG: hypothetical protein ABS87_03345 [Sphingomonas sp. SCN 67-18]|uniref:hypothetical protein n=1 Tax=uncultured Sphingomonas sp. TaxID=158754 RepID=UPI00086BEEAF|nr:hypothetical protein [Sphingomonas sp. SCN 67-18]ODU22084.1 MAG: hypothetical protein ABS87_03345 [Sphingomonas sp. SCN 67-18]